MEGGPVSRPCSPEAACERAFYPETMVRKVVDFHDAGTALLGGLTNIGAFCASSRCVKMKRIANDLHQDPATARGASPLPRPATRWRGSGLAPR
ncbi:hypothetical protein DMX06_25040 [Pseudomonas mosselii]|nr:hypothetical protein DMX06_25040 [Pseudomonas mosselii]